MPRVAQIPACTQGGVHILGLGDAIDVYTGEVTITDETEAVIESENDEGESEITEVDRSTLTREVEDGHGLFVIAQSNEAVHSVPVGVGVGFASFQATIGVNVVASTTEARVEDGVTVNGNNTGAGIDQQVAVRARGDTHLTTDAVTLAFGPLGTYSGTVATQVLAKNVTASLGGDVDVRGGIDVDAASHEAVRTLAVDGSASLSPLAGALGVTVVANDVLAEIADGAVVTSDGDLIVEASDESDIDLIVGQASIAVGVGIGSGLTVGVADSEVTARIGAGAATDAKGTTRVAAATTQDFDAVTISGRVGGVAVIGGALGVNVVTTETRALIDAGAQVNQTAAYVTDAQDVEVDASAVTGVNSFTGQFGAAVGGSVGVSADVLVVRDTTVASIGDSDMIAEMDDKTSTDHNASLRDSDKGTVVETQHTEGRQQDDLIAAKTTGIGGNVDPSDDPRAGGTSAYVGDDATVTAGHDIDVRATDRTHYHALAGGGSVGAVGVGGMFAAGHIRRNTRAYTGAGATLSAGNTVTIEAQALDNGGASRIEAIGVSASVVGAAGTIAIADVYNQTTAELGDDTTAEGEAGVSVSATTDTNLVVESVGAAVAILASAGTASAVAKVGGETAVRTGSGVEITTTDDDEDADVALTATTEGSTTAEAVAAAAGLAGFGVSGAGALASVTDEADTRAEVGFDSFVTSAGGIDVAASDDAENTALATGVAVAGTLAAGASIAGVIADKDVVATTGTGVELRGEGIAITAEQGHKEKTLAGARAVAGSGSQFVGLAGTAADIKATVDVEASTGADNTVIDTGGEDGGITLEARNAARTRSDVVGISIGGLFGAGSHTALSTTDLDTTARLGAGATVRTDRGLDIRAISDENVLAQTIAGAGGAAVAQAGLTTVTHVADVWAGTDDSDSLTDIMAGTVSVSAVNEGGYDGSLDSTGVALAQAAAGLLVVNGDVSVTARLGDRTGITTQGLDVLADNSVRKDLVDGANFKVLQGGAFNVAVGGSTGGLASASRASVGEASAIVVTGTPEDQGTASVVALNRPVVDDEARIDSGGLLSVPLAASTQIVGLTTEVEIGASTSLATQAGDVVLAARGDADVHARAFANTYGLAGAGQGASIATVTATDRLFVREGADVVGMGEVFLLAGADAQGAGLIEPYAETRVHNRTAFPFSGVPIAEALATRTSSVEIESAARVASLRHMTVQANDGGLLAHHLGRATDLWKEAAETIAGWFGADAEGALDIKGGHSTNVGASSINIDGTLRTGVRNKIALTFGTDFSPYYRDGTGKGKYAVGFDEEVGEWRLFDLDALPDDFDPANPPDGVLVGPLTPLEQSEGFEWTILTDQNLGSTIRDEIDRLEVVKARYGAKSTSESARAKAEIEARIAFLEGILATRNANEFVDIIEVAPAEAATGNVFLWAEAVTGSGLIDAPGDAEILITNDSPMPLKVTGLTIPDEPGGRILLNNEIVHTIEGLTLIDAEVTPEPQIIVQNRFDKNSGVYNPDGIPNLGDPDLLVAGQINNVNGLAAILNDTGSVIATADVRADTVIIDAGGDFVFDSPETLLNIGPHPEAGFGPTADFWEAFPEQALPASPGQNTIQQLPSDSFPLAANNVYINADTINLNGVIQSGLPDKTIHISQAEVNAALAKAASTGERFVQIDVVDPSLNGARIVTGGIKAELDAELGEIRILDAEVKGGTVLLSGRIASTGDGKVNVVDGFGRIVVTNDSTLPVSIEAINTGGIEGQITLIDKAKNNGLGLPLVTQFERVGDSI